MVLLFFRDKYTLYNRRIKGGDRYDGDDII